MCVVVVFVCVVCVGGVVCVWFVVGVVRLCGLCVWYLCVCGVRGSGVCGCECACVVWCGVCMCGVVVVFVCGGV